MKRPASSHIGELDHHPSLPVSLIQVHAQDMQHACWVNMKLDRVVTNEQLAFTGIWVK